MLQEVTADPGKKLGANLDVAQRVKEFESLADLGKGLLNDIGSFQDKLFTTVRKDSVPIALLVENKEIAESMKSIFELCWKLAKKS